MTKTNYYIKQADIHDYNFFYAREEQKETCVIAYVLMKGRRRIGIGGFFVREAACLAFVKIKEELPKKFFFKELKKGLAEYSKLLTKPIYAVRDETIKGSDIFLKKLGFQFYCTSLEKEEIYKL